MSLFDYDYLDSSTYENFEELLERQKVDPNECDENGMTPLHHIASQLFDMSTVINTDFNVIKLLLRYNANPNIPQFFHKKLCETFQQKYWRIKEEN